MPATGQPGDSSASPVVASDGELDWSTAVQIHATTQCGDRRLFLVIQPGGKRWGAMAVEAPNGADVDAVFADHGHKVLGTYDSFARAVEACEGFAKHWAKGSKSTRFRDCACDEIGPLVGLGRDVSPVVRAG